MLSSESLKSEHSPPRAGNETRVSILVNTVLEVLATAVIAGSIDERVDALINEAGNRVQREIHTHTVH